MVPSVKQTLRKSENKRTGDAMRLVKKVKAAGLGIMERHNLVSKDDRLSLQTQCDLRGIGKSGLYYLPKGKVRRIWRL